MDVMRGYEFTADWQKKKIRTYMFFHSLDYTPKEEKEGVEHYYTLRSSLTSLGPKVVRLYPGCTENLPDGSPLRPIKEKHERLPYFLVFNDPALLQLLSYKIHLSAHASSLICLVVA